MKNSFGRVVLGCVVLGAVAMVTACSGTAASDGLEPLRSAVREAPAGVDEITVDEGKDGFSRYVFLVLNVPGDELTPEALTETLDVVGETLPEAYDEVRLVARGASGERVEIETAFAGVGLDDSYLVSPQRAHLTADAVRAFANEHG